MNKKPLEDIDKVQSFIIYFKKNNKDKMVEILKDWTEQGKNWSDEAINNLILLDEIMEIPQIAMLIEHFKYFKDFTHYKIKYRENLSQTAIEFDKYLQIFSSTFKSVNNTQTNFIHNEGINKSNFSINTIVQEETAFINTNSSSIFPNNELDLENLDLNNLDELDESFDLSAFDFDD